MKLIISDYLASLRERDELDVLLPDLLSQMGLTVLTRPQRGTDQKGVDVVAVGKMSGQDEEKIYLLTIKPGNLTHDSWNGTSPQSLRPSLDQIQDDYIPHRILPEHKNKPIVICVCIGGSITEPLLSTVRGNLSARPYDIELWNGEKIANLIVEHFLREDVLPTSNKSLLRKSLALVEEPETSFGFFRQMLYLAEKKLGDSPKDKLRALRQMNVCTLVLAKWCRDVDNLEAAYLASELALLFSWHVCKDHALREKPTALQKAFDDALNNAHRVQLLISHEYVAKIVKWAGKLYALSYSVRGANAVDTNLKLFDVLGRVALSGLWHYSILRSLSVAGNKEGVDKAGADLAGCAWSICELIANNPILNTPCKDSQIVDIALACLVLRAGGQAQYAGEWLLNLLERVKLLIEGEGAYPCILQSYPDLLDHPHKDDPEYFKKVTSSSEMYPAIALIAGVLGRDDVFAAVQDLKKTALPHCNFQMWYLDDESEANFYLNKGMHGLELASLDVGNKQLFLEAIFRECRENSAFRNMSIMKPGLFYLTFVGCRHHRLPVPPDFFLAIYKKKKKGRQDESPREDS